MIPAASAFASGGSYCDDNKCMSFFSPGIIHSPAEEPIFLTWNNGYRRVNIPSDIPDINVAEWVKYFGGKLDQRQTSYLVYTMTADQLRNLISSFEQQNVKLSGTDEELKSALEKSIRRSSLNSALHYLLLAKQVEPLALKNNWNRWSYPPQPQPIVNVDTKSLIEEAQRAIPKSDSFIAARYRFQILRLLFYSEQYALAAEYYEKTSRNFSTESSVKYRTMELAGGAYYKLKNFGKADYLYSVVFDRYPPLKGSSYKSFHPMEDADWKETLALAKSPREKEALWQLLGIYADSGAAIDNIYAMNPRSPLLPLLLMREVNQAEQTWTSNQFVSRYAANYARTGQTPRPDIDVIGKKRLDRIRSIADAGNTYKPYLWQLAAGHLLTLAGDAATAEMYLSRASKTMPNEPDLQTQLRMSTLLSKVRSLKGIDKTLESYLAKELEWLRGNASEPAVNLNDWILTELAGVYTNAGDPVRGAMLGNTSGTRTRTVGSGAYQTLANLNQLLELMRTATSDFDRFLVRNYTHNEVQIQELRALNQLYEGNFSDALETFKLAGNAGEQQLNFDPFEAHNKDCIHCDWITPKRIYTKTTFIQRMLTLSEGAKGSGESAAESSLLLANGFYNMSYFGNSRDIYFSALNDLFITNTLYTTGIIEDPNRINLNMDLAERYYLQAAALSRDREFKAKAIFMAAKTERNRKFISTDKTDSHIYFKRLKDDFADTQYFSEIIQECQYFAKYVR